VIYPVVNCYLSVVSIADSIDILAHYNNSWNNTRELLLAVCKLLPCMDSLYNATLAGPQGNSQT
jgi:hypothetical protein